MDKCEVFAAPLRIPAYEKPANYDQMLNIIQIFAPGYKKESGKHGFHYGHLFFIFISIAMVFMYLAFLISNELTRFISKLIRFQKWITTYTAIPLYCCLMILSMSLNFGYETSASVNAITNAEKWKDTALSRHFYMKDSSLLQLQCLNSRIAILNPEHMITEEEKIFGITYAQVETTLKNLNVLTEKKKKYSDLKQLGFNSHYRDDIRNRFRLDRITDIMFGPFRKEINETYQRLDLPTVEILNWTRGTIMAINAITILYTLLICMMIFLEVKNSYPVIIKVIQWIHPFLVIFILLEYYLTWNMCSSIFNSYSRFSKLIDTGLKMDRHRIKFANMLDADASILHLIGRKSFNRLTDEHCEWLQMDLFDTYQTEINEALKKLKNLTVLTSEQQTFNDFFNKCGSMSKCVKKAALMNATQVLFAVDDKELEWGFADQAISYFRYVSYFSKYTFVPIVSPFWKIMPMPSIMFFNLMFIVLVIPLIKKNNEERSSEAFI